MITMARLWLSRQYWYQGDTIFKAILLFPR